jgi:hypothetical protein
MRLAAQTRRRGRADAPAWPGGKTHFFRSVFPRRTVSIAVLIIGSQW